MPTLPEFAAATFNAGTAIDNPYFPLEEGNVLSYSGSKIDEESGETETESNDLFVSTEKKLIAGVETFVILDTAYANDVLVESTLDWYAQDSDGNVWYLGEIAYNYRYDDAGNYIGTDNDGSWETAVEGALPGWIMPAAPAVGDSYYQEYYPGEAVDEALVVSLDAEVSIGAGDFDNVLQTMETSALDPDILEFKYYAPGVGQVLVEEEINELGEPDLVVELVGIRQTGAGQPGEDVDHPEVEDFAGDGDTFYVTYLGKEAMYENALGAYIFDLDTGEIGEGRILFDSSEDLEFGDVASIEVEEGQGVGLFLIPNVEDFALDLSAFEDGGLFFSNMLTGAAAALGDSLPPLVIDEEGTALPIHAFHALGGEDGFNFLNPAAAALSTELDLDCFGSEDEEDVTFLGFEDMRITQEGFDGDYNDFMVAVSDTPLGDSLDFDDLVVGSSAADHLRGGRDDDLLLGFDGNDMIRGRAGDDRLCGDDGRDKLQGGHGDDELFGGDGSDTLSGGHGNDLLDGGEGNDLLTGGRGEDVFSFGLGEGDDKIRDFQVGVDSIDLSDTRLGYGDLAISDVGWGTRIDLGGSTITLQGVSLGQVDETSFIF